MIENKRIVPRIAVITNSTYDGLVYNVDTIKQELLDAGIQYIHFDEAWFPYAKFHPFYQGKFAMSETKLKKAPTVFSTRSEKAMAESGFYQKALTPDRVCSLVRVGIERNLNVYPLMSLGKHRLVIHFYSADIDNKPQQVKENIHFILMD